MSAVATLPTRLTVDDAWRTFQALAMQAAADPRLFADREHYEAMHRAHVAFAELLDRAERRR